MNLIPVVTLLISQGTEQKSRWLYIYTVIETFEQSTEKGDFIRQNWRKIYFRDEIRSKTAPKKFAKRNINKRRIKNFKPKIENFAKHIQIPHLPLLIVNF